MSIAISACPACGFVTTVVAFSRLSAIVNYYLCKKCGHIWAFTRRTRPSSTTSCRSGRGLSNFQSQLARGLDSDASFDLDSSNRHAHWISNSRRPAWISLRRRRRKLCLTAQSQPLSGTTDPSFRSRRPQASWGTESDVPQSGQMMMSSPVCRTATVSGLDRHTGQSPIKWLRSGGLFRSMTEGAMQRTPRRPV